MKAKKSTLRPVIVTTLHRGVFFGYAANTDGETIKLERARMCVYWSAAMKGILGLAVIGPDKDCKISPAASTTLRNVTAIFEVAPEAVTRWEASPWA